METKWEITDQINDDMLSVIFVIGSLDLLSYHMQRILPKGMKEFRDIAELQTVPTTSSQTSLAYIINNNELRNMKLSGNSLTVRTAVNNAISLLRSNKKFEHASFYCVIPNITIECIPSLLFKCNLGETELDYHTIANLGKAAKIIIPDTVKGVSHLILNGFVFDKISRNGGKKLSNATQIKIYKEIYAVNDFYVGCGLNLLACKITKEEGFEKIQETRDTEGYGHIVVFTENFLNGDFEKKVRNFAENTMPLLDEMRSDYFHSCFTIMDTNCCTHSIYVVLPMVIDHIVEVITTNTNLDKLFEKEVISTSTEELDDGELIDAIDMEKAHLFEELMESSKGIVLFDAETYFIECIDFDD